MGGLLSYLPNYSMETPQGDGLISYLPNNCMKNTQGDGLLLYLPNYSMETPQWAGYYHIYLNIVWKPYKGRVIIILSKLSSNVFISLTIHYKLYMV